MPYFYEIVLWTNDIVYARFEVIRPFLCVFMNGFRNFVRYELWVNVPVAIFFRRWIDSTQKESEEFMNISARTPFVVFQMRVSLTEVRQI